MPRSIVVVFTALDGIIEDSDVSGGTPKRRLGSP